MDFKGKEPGIPKISVNDNQSFERVSYINWLDNIV